MILSNRQFEVYRCPTCNADEPNYDQRSDETVCRKCGLRMSGELVDAVFNRDDLPRFWITRDNRCLLIADMETDHIQKCIGQIFTRSAEGWRGKFMEPLIEELKRRLSETNYQR